MATKSNTGKYVFDEKLGKIVKISDRTPKVASKGSSPERAACGQPMPPGGCGGGGCGA